MEGTRTVVGKGRDEDEDVDVALAAFEKKIDKTDPEQVKVLEEIRAQTRLVHKERGDWNRPNTFRNWNNYESNGSVVDKNRPKPLQNESYREYLEHVERERGGGRKDLRSEPKRLTES